VLKQFAIQFELHTSVHVAVQLFPQDPYAEQDAPQVPPQLCEHEPVQPEAQAPEQILLQVEVQSPPPQEEEQEEEHALLAHPDPQ